MNNTDPNFSPKRRMHPLVATAAAAVIVASLAATAAITGVFPKASSSVQSGQTQAAAIVTPPAPDGDATSASARAPDALPPAPPSAATAATAATGAPQYAQPYAPTQAPPSAPPQQAQYAQQPPAERASCPTTCGVVEAVSAVRHEGHGTGIGAVGGAVAGGVIGNQFGSGGGRTAMTLLGALGGGVGGNAIEKHMRSTTSYSVRVRMENGRTRYFTYSEAPPFQRGERVHVENGRLVAG